MQMGHQLERLNAAHLHIVELCLKGHTISQIAQLLDRSAVGVGLIVNSPLFQDELARRRSQKNKTNDETGSADLAEAERVLNQASVDAAKTLKQQLSLTDEKVRQTSAIAILQQTFNRQKVQTNSGVTGVVVMSPAGLELLQRALSEDTKPRADDSAGDSIVEGELVKADSQEPVEV
jgi:hypothetical protein